jgi:cation:H+ antiporter
VTDRIADELQLGASLVGALFLGIATSLPELASSVALVRKKNFNAMIGNICGSNIFNFFILFVADVFCRKSSILNAALYSQLDFSQATLLIIFGVIAVAAGIVSLLCHKNQVKSRILYRICGLIIVGAYFSFLIMSV